MCVCVSIMHLCPCVRAYVYVCVRVWSSGTNRFGFLIQQQSSKSFDLKMKVNILKSMTFTLLLKFDSFAPVSASYTTVVRTYKLVRHRLYRKTTDWRCFCNCLAACKSGFASQHCIRRLNNSKHPNQTHVLTVRWRLTVSDSIESGSDVVTPFQ